MVVRDLYQNVAEERIIARAIFEDHCKPQNLNGWITKYYAQLVKLKNSKVKKSDLMLYFSVYQGRKMYGDEAIDVDVSGFSYDDIKKGEECFYGIEHLTYKEYASLFIPDYTVQVYGEEAVAAEVLREYGWNGFDKSILCPDEMRIKVLAALDDMKTKLFLSDEKYYERCRKQFREAYEGKEVTQWEDVPREGEYS